MAGGIGAASFVVAPASGNAFGVAAPSVTTFAAFVTGRPLWPSDVTGLILWLPGDQIQGIASGASLSAWTDSSASASHATQPSAVSQGVYIANAQNGLGAVAFGNGLGQIMSSPTSIGDASTLCFVTSPSSTFLAGSGRVLGSNTGANIRVAQSFGSWVCLRGSNLTDGAAPPNVWKSIIAFADVSAQSVCTLTVSGTKVSGSILTSGTTGLVSTIGAGAPSSSTYSGLIGEIAVFDRNLAEIERSSLDSYFRTKWAL